MSIICVILSLVSYYHGQYRHVYWNEMSNELINAKLSSMFFFNELMFNHYNLICTSNAPRCLSLTAPYAEKLNNLDFSANPTLEI